MFERLLTCFGYNSRYQVLSMITAPYLVLGNPITCRSDGVKHVVETTQWASQFDRGW